MARKQIRIIGFCLVIGLIVFLTGAMLGCTAKPAPVSAHSSTVSSIAVKPSSDTVQVHSTQQYTATEIYSDGSTADVTSQVKWESLDQTVASISSAGVATGISPGSSSISASLSGITSSASSLDVVP